MTYVLAPDQTVKIFPYSIGDLQRDNPNTSFPRNPSEETLAAYNVFPVVEQPTPDYNPATQNLNQLKPVFSGGQWLQTWRVSNASDEEIANRIRANADYIAFWDALTTSTIYTAIRTQSMASLPMNTLATEFIALIGDAKAGRANTVAIQASISAILTTGTFTLEQLTELGDALDAGNLSAVLSL
jgi:hypothetical protein